MARLVLGSTAGDVRVHAGVVDRPVSDLAGLTGEAAGGRAECAGGAHYRRRHHRGRSPPGAGGRRGPALGHRDRAARE